jgi:hypothetical protein
VLSQKWAPVLRLDTRQDKDLEQEDDSKQKLNTAAQIATHGYDYSLALQRLLNEQTDATSSKQEKAEQEKTIVSCLNNYVLYLAQRGSQRDINTLDTILPKLGRVDGFFIDE